MAQAEPKYEVEADVVATDFDGKDAVVLNLATKKYYTLNETATLIWSGIEKGMNFAALVDLLTEKYEVSPERAMESVRGTLSSLQAQQLVRPCPQSP